MRDGVTLAMTVRRPAGKALADVLLRDGCLLDALPKMQREDLSTLFAFGQAEALELSKKVAAYGNAEVAPLVGPVLVVQGEADQDIPVGLTDTLVEQVDQATGREHRCRIGHRPGCGRGRRRIRVAQRERRAAAARRHRNR